MPRFLACIAISFAALVTTALPAAADTLCGPAPSAPLVAAIYPAPIPGGQMEVDWNASEPCIGDGGTLQYDVYITVYDRAMQPVAAASKVDHVMAGNTQTPGLYPRFYDTGFTSCNYMYLDVTVYAWSVNNAHRSAPGVSNPVANPGFAPVATLCPGPLGS
jgi:hypothetical protein